MLFDLSGDSRRPSRTHELPLENYYGPAVCLDIPKTHWELITVEDIDEAAKKVEGGIQEGDWVIICTGMDKIASVRDFLVTFENGETYLLGRDSYYKTKREFAKYLENEVETG